MDPIINEFLLESSENLEQLTNDLVALEHDPTGDGHIASLFRAIHTIKGSCGFLGFPKLEALSHAGESLLADLREGRLSVTTEIIDVLLRVVDAIRQILADIETTEGEGDVLWTELIASLDNLHDGDTPGLPGDRVRQDAPWPGPEPSAPLEPDPVSRANRVEATIRVDVDLLDKLMNLVGELVLARNQIRDLGAARKDRDFVSAWQHLNLTTSELQAGVMKARMQPIANVWRAFPRVVRDLALASGKQLRLDTEGERTELDRSIIEAIRDPLTHLLRNAIDHGIEPPDQRQACGKPAEGRVLLSASHQAGHVHIEIADDGAGIDAQRILELALERGLVSPEQADRMSEQDLLELILLPGFSTRETVSKLSGRGVGMDVVRSKVEAVGGSMKISTRPGKGTTVRMSLPLTLAIIPALIIRADGERYALPQSNLLEVVNISGEQEDVKGIELIGDVPLYRLRGKLLPLVHLSRQLGIAGEPPGTPAQERGNSIIVLQANNHTFGLVVEEILETEEIVVKPLGCLLRGIRCFAGATILGDARVALILDVAGLAQNARLESDDRDGAAKEVADPGPTGATGRTPLLLVEIAGGQRAAIPLDQVSRLERLPRCAVETVGGREVIQCRGEIMPLARFSAIDGSCAAGASDDILDIVVHHERGRNVGLVVERIIDITEQSLEGTTRADAGGGTALAVVQQRVAELIDMKSIIGVPAPCFIGDPIDAQPESSR